MLVGYKPSSPNLIDKLNNDDMPLFTFVVFITQTELSQLQKDTR